MFVDIHGFTPLFGVLEPEQVVAIPNQYLEVTTNAVSESGGTVSKFAGDITMALSSALPSREDYVFRIVKTGLDMAAARKALEEDSLKLYGKTVSLEVGVNCGEAVIGNIGTSSRMEYTAIGNTVNTTTRLESRTKAGEVLVNPEVYRRLRNRIEVESLGPCTLGRISEPMEVFWVTRIQYPARLAPQFSKR